jgi:predicted porin
MGTDDAWDEFTENSVNGTPYIMSGINDGNDATKIIYLSPQFFGFDAGVSYSPNRNEGENFLTSTSTTAYQRDYTGLTNEISAALRYRGTFGPVGVGASFVAQFADAGRQSATGAPVAVQNQNVTAYSGGLLVRAFGFALGGEYTWGNYTGAAPAGAALPKGWDGSKHYVLGGTYTIGALSLGAMYGSGTQDNGTAADAPADRTQTYFGLGVAYVLAPGMTLFANYNQIKDENVPLLGQAGSISAGATKNTLAKFGTSDTTRDITAVIGGVRVAF